MAALLDQDAGFFESAWRRGLAQPPSIRQDGASEEPFSMTASPTPLHVRPATAAAAEAMRQLLNATIAIGGSTALETPFSAEAFSAYFLAGPDLLSCLVAEDRETGRVLGFQSISRAKHLPEDVGDIGTFADTKAARPGVGSALFPQTRAKARDLGLSAINATIRADNVSGLAYYEKMGFRTHSVAERVPLADGTPVDRISKRYPLG